jgi:hypothetical protein
MSSGEWVSISLAALGVVGTFLGYVIRLERRISRIELWLKTLAADQRVPFDSTTNWANLEQQPRPGGRR